MGCLPSKRVQRGTEHSAIQQTITTLSPEPTSLPPMNQSTDSLFESEDPYGQIPSLRSSFSSVDKNDETPYTTMPVQPAFPPIMTPRLSSSDQAEKRKSRSFIQPSTPSRPRRLCQSQRVKLTRTRSDRSPTGSLNTSQMVIDHECTILPTIIEVNA